MDNTPASRTGSTGRTVRAQDVSAPLGSVEIGGERYPLRFSNHAARVAEDVYAEIYAASALREAPPMGYADILRELAAGRWRAIMAVLYGALVAAGADMTWETFDDQFRLDSIDGVREKIQRAVAGSLPDTANTADAEENP